MIRIIKPGNSKRTITCSHCDALLEYTGVDVEKEIIGPDFSIINSYIICPDCGEKIILNSEEVPPATMPNLIGTTY